MEYFNAIKLRDKWGKKYCDHPRLERLYYEGAFLITYACPVCGAEFTISRKMEMYENRKRKN